MGTVVLVMPDLLQAVLDGLLTVLLVLVWREYRRVQRALAGLVDARDRQARS